MQPHLGTHSLRDRGSAKREPALPGRVTAMREAKKVERYPVVQAHFLRPRSRKVRQPFQADLRAVSG